MIQHHDNVSFHLHEHVQMFSGTRDQSSQFCSWTGHWRWYCYVLLGLYTCALPLGTLGNVAALTYYACLRKTWTASSVVQLNLALCDSAWILMLPLTVYFNLQRPHVTETPAFCKLKKISFNVNIYGSIYFLTLVSFDRYAGTVHPISSLKWWGVGKARLCCLCTWTLLLLCSIPDLFITFGLRAADNVTICLELVRGPVASAATVSVARTLLGFLLPLVAMLTFYTLTARVLRGLPTCQGLGQRSGKPLRMLSAAIVVFVVSFLPYHAVVMTLALMGLHPQLRGSNAGALYVCYMLAEAVCGLSSCLDPVLYILASDRFHKGCLAFTRRPRARGCCPRRCRVSPARRPTEAATKAAWH